VQELKFKELKKEKELQLNLKLLEEEVATLTEKHNVLKKKLIKAQTGIRVEELLS
jgi:hypothetical protein